MPTCLFTGESLTPTSKVEHTIPRALGGRIKSRIVSSDNFNARCGDKLDPFLARRYARLTNVLAPLLSQEHRTGKLAVDAPGEPAGLVLDDGAITRSNVVVVERDPVTNRPRSALAEDVSAFKKIAKEAGWTTMTSSVVPPMKGDRVFVRDVPSICVELEIAILKCVLLTFDHLLGGADDSFARHNRLAAVRNFVHRAGQSARSNSPPIAIAFSLGYLKVRTGALYRELRRRN